MIKQSQQVLLEAIKASLFGNSITVPDNTDWEAVIKEAKEQTVMGLINPVLLVHDESSAQCKAFYMRLLYEQNNLIKLLDENNIPCVILKGCAAAVYYPKPYLRAMGDVDFLVPLDYLDDAMKIMESNGFEYLHGKDENGVPIGSDRHVAYVKNGIEFELHHHFSSIGFDIDEILEKAIDKREYRNLNGYSIPVLPEIENGLVLLGHINHHLKNSTLGLRQIIDWEMYYYSVMENEKWEKEFVPIARETGLLELAVNVTNMCKKHLGLSKTLKQIDNSEEDCTDELLENLLLSGNFGRKQRPLSESSGRKISEVIGDIKSKGAYSYFQNNGLHTWKLCKKVPLLKPFAFIYGFFRFLVRGTTIVLKTGRLKEQLRYVKDKSKLDRELGIRTKKKNNE